MNTSGVEDLVLVLPGMSDVHLLVTEGSVASAGLPIMDAMRKCDARYSQLTLDVEIDAPDEEVVRVLRSRDVDAHAYVCEFSLQARRVAVCFSRELFLDRFPSIVGTERRVYALGMSELWIALETSIFAPTSCFIKQPETVSTRP